MLVVRVGGATERLGHGNFQLLYTMDKRQVETRMSRYKAKKKKRNTKEKTETDQYTGSQKCERVVSHFIERLGEGGRPAMSFCG